METCLGGWLYPISSVPSEESTYCLSNPASSSSSLVAKKAKGKVWGQFFSRENGRLNWLKASQRGVIQDEK